MLFNPLFHIRRVVNKPSTIYFLFSLHFTCLSICKFTRLWTLLNSGQIPRNSRGVNINFRVVNNILSRHAVTESLFAPRFYVILTMYVQLTSSNLIRHSAINRFVFYSLVPPFLFSVIFRRLSRIRHTRQILIKQIDLIHHVSVHLHQLSVSHAR